MWFSSQDIMIHDSTPHRIFKISELTRAITSQLLPVSQGSAVNLACACRYLEEPVLSTLWETQESLCVLVEVFPEDTWSWETPAFDASTVRSPNLPAEEDRYRTLKFTLVDDRGGPITRGLEQSPALRILDARSPRGRVVNPWGGHVP